MNKVWFHTDQRLQGADISTGDILRSVIYCSRKDSTSIAVMLMYITVKKNA